MFQTILLLLPSGSNYTTPTTHIGCVAKTSPTKTTGDIRIINVCSVSSITGHQNRSCPLLRRNQQYQCTWHGNKWCVWIIPLIWSCFHFECWSKHHACRYIGRHWMYSLRSTTQCSMGGVISGMFNYYGGFLLKDDKFEASRFSSRCAILGMEVRNRRWNAIIGEDNQWVVSPQSGFFSDSMHPIWLLLCRQFDGCCGGIVDHTRMPSGISYKHLGDRFLGPESTPTEVFGAM